MKQRPSLPPMPPSPPPAAAEPVATDDEDLEAEAALAGHDALVARAEGELAEALRRLSQRGPR